MSGCASSRLDCQSVLFGGSRDYSICLLMNGVIDAAKRHEQKTETVPAYDAGPADSVPR